MRGCDLFIADPTVRPNKKAMDRRTLRVYRSLAKSATPLSPFQVAERIGIDSKSARFIMNRLTEKGYALEWDRARHLTRSVAEIDRPDEWMLDQLSRKRERDTMRGRA